MSQHIKSTKGNGEFYKKVMEIYETSEIASKERWNKVIEELKTGICKTATKGEKSYTFDTGDNIKEMEYIFDYFLNEGFLVEQLDDGGADNFTLKITWKR